MRVTAKCLCENGWRGRLCSHPHLVNNWTPWTSWSSCYPSCQRILYEGNRHRYRRRKCLDPSHGDCYFSERDKGRQGETRADHLSSELRLCRPRPCNRYLGLVPHSIEGASADAVCLYTKLLSQKTKWTP